MLGLRFDRASSKTIPHSSAGTASGFRSKGPRFEPPASAIFDRKMSKVVPFQVEKLPMIFKEQVNDGVLHLGTQLG